MKLEMAKTKPTPCRIFNSVPEHYVLNVSFSSGTFPEVHAGGQLLSLFIISEICFLLHEENTKCKICGVSTEVFQGRRQLLAVFTVHCTNKSINM